MGVAIDDIIPATTQVNPAFWMKAAQGAIRRECGWHVAPIIDETLELDGMGGTTLLIPSLRVREIQQVVSDGVDVTERVKHSRTAGVLTLASGWSRDVGAITVKLKHGFAADEVPEVAALIVTLTKRAAAGGIVVQQAIGGASQRLATGKDGAALGVPLLESERATLAPYVLTWGP
ncbi:hypothetical protein Leucomu_13490 [Leucobacter muris]|uniref:Phage gp6-like head-tail connector protein n=1 Tax=Leucobacter muris TaxID=1935379 RepID=A0ABX5QI67_9MICO|nr:hypothetical protein [Leucobacter muris]QAB18787.1 hypothetical protein Leucomu_13490 [Leucobacter muris]